MEIVPVIDLLGGQVVRAVAGDRASYRPIQSELFDGSDLDVAIEALRRATNARHLYIADLDSLCRNATIDLLLIRKLANDDCELWIDANWIGDQRSLETLSTIPNVRPIISLETLMDFRDLRLPLFFASSLSPIFSVDMRDGELLTDLESLSRLSPVDLIGEVFASGFRDIITLDLATVGSHNGPIVSESIREVMNNNARRCRWISGGGVRDMEDLIQLERAGCDFALVASALHNKCITRKDIDRLAGFDKPFEC